MGQVRGNGGLLKLNFFLFYPYLGVSGCDPNMDLSLFFCFFIGQFQK